MDDGGSTDSAPTSDRRPKSPSSDPTHPTFRGAKLPHGKHPAPGTTKPVPLDGDPIPDPFLSHKILSENPYGQFKTAEEFEWALNYSRGALSDAEVANLKRMLGGMYGPHAHTLPSGKTMRRLFKESPFADPSSCLPIDGNDGRDYAFVHRGVIDCINWLAGQVHLAGDVTLSAEVHVQTGPDGKTPERVYSELHTGDAWANAQAKLGKDGKLMLPIIISSNKTRVRFFLLVCARPVCLASVR